MRVNARQLEQVQELRTSSTAIQYRAHREPAGRVLEISRGDPLERAVRTSATREAESNGATWRLRRGWAGRARRNGKISSSEQTIALISMLDKEDPSVTAAAATRHARKALFKTCS